MLRNSKANKYTNNYKYSRLVVYLYYKKQQAKAPSLHLYNNKTILEKMKCKAGMMIDRDVAGKKV